jgi:HEAT repeat protein
LFAGLAALIWFIPDLRYGLLRLVSKEQFYENRPTSYWIDTLQAGKDTAREHAAHVLGKVGAEDPGVIPALMAALKDQNFIVRKNAAIALGENGPAAKSVTPALVETLKDDNPVVRREAAVALAKVQGDSDLTVPALIAALKDSDVWVRDRAIGSLGELGPRAKAAIPALLEIMKQSPGRETDTSGRAIAALQKIDPEIIRPLLVKELSSPDASTRAQAVRALGGLGDAAKDALPAMEKLLKDPDNKVRVVAAQAVWKMDRAKVSAVVPVFIEGLRDQTSWYNRGTSAHLLGQIGPEAKAAIPVLMETLKDQHEDIRGLAADALGQMGPEAKAAIPALEQARDNDAEEDVRRRAAKALQRINSKEAA